MTKPGNSDNENQVCHFPGLAGRTCVITGGAGIIGQSLCVALASAGIRTAILDLDLQSATHLAAELESTTGTKCLAVQTDVLSRNSLEMARDKVIEELGQPMFLINAAGGNSPLATTDREVYDQLDEPCKNIFNLQTEGFERVFNLNFLGTLLPIQVFGEQMARQKKGVILTISSMNAFRPLTKIPAYSAAKASVNNFTQWLAVNLAPSGVRVNGIAPGFFLTNQNRFLLTNPETGEATPRGKKIIANTPLGQYGQPEDLQGAVLFLLSDLSRFITGIILPVDGGYSAYGGV
jgi:NAD(P)-dependent dehydrogenase (short-subunit alcohol dehydrogenase family)